MPLLISIEESVESPWLLGGIRFYRSWMTDFDNFDMPYVQIHFLRSRLTNSFRVSVAGCHDLKWNMCWTQMAPQIHHDSPDHEICDFPASRDLPRLVVLFYGIGFGILQAFLMVHSLQAMADRHSSIPFNPPFVPVESLALDLLLRPLPLPFRWLNSFQWKCALQGWVSATTCLAAYLRRAFFFDVFPPKEWLTIDYSVNICKHA